MLPGAEGGGLTFCDNCSVLYFRHGSNYAGTYISQNPLNDTLKMDILYGVCVAGEN